MMLAQPENHQMVEPSQSAMQAPMAGTQVHNRTEAFALMEELKKRQRPFEKLQLAQANEAQYRAEAYHVETLMETLEAVALTTAETGVIPADERIVLKKSLHQAVQAASTVMGATEPPLTSDEVDTFPSVNLDQLKQLLLYPTMNKAVPPNNEDQGLLESLGGVIAEKLAIQLQHHQVVQQAFGLHQPSQEKRVLCKYLQQLLGEIEKLRTENEALTQQLSQFQPAGLGLYRKTNK
jgi:hypothetical protein